MTIHIALNAWQIAFIVLYLASVVMAWFIMSCVPTSGFAFITWALAIFWPLIFILAPIQILWAVIVDKWEQRKDRRKK